MAVVATGKVGKLVSCSTGAVVRLARSEKEFFKGKTIKTCQDFSDPKSESETEGWGTGMGAYRCRPVPDASRVLSRSPMLSFHSNPMYCLRFSQIKNNHNRDIRYSKIHRIKNT